MAVILGVYPSGIVYLYMVIHLVSQFCTIYLLGAGVFAIEVSHLIGICIYVNYLRLGRNTSFPRTKRNEMHAMEINMHNSESSFLVQCIGEMK